MPPPFQSLTISQFGALLERFPFTRRINAVHMHHTWKPDRSQYRGHDSIMAMWRFHTESNGWSDIAQHVSIAPDGTIWLGRNWNLPPASAAGHNGNRVLGPFMFETIGNFDVGHDPLDGPQREAVIRVIAHVQEKFALPLESLLFHNAMSSKTCPGSTVRYHDILDDVRQARAALSEAVPVGRGMDEPPFPDNLLEDAAIVDDALAAISRGPATFHEEERAEHLQPAAPLADGRGEPPAAAERAAESLTPEQLESLRPHLINLNMGQLSGDGAFKSSPGDIDAIFEERLPAALAQARARGDKLRIVFWAHGGLVKESRGLALALNHVGWWRENNVYPIYFVWETGAFETIGQLLQRAREGTTRALRRDIFDFTTDPLIHETVRALQGPRVWGGMKLAAELASRPGEGSTPDGGALYAAQRLALFCRGNESDVELHAVGHSAGSIFHAHFVPAALAAGVARFRSLHLLAPAARVDLFHQHLAPHIGKEIEQLTIFTMAKSFERADNCAAVYRKSLLYLIYHALEPERRTPILGLEESIRSDQALKKLLGLGASGAPGEVVWSRTPAAAGASASQATSHGGFDDDPATMASIVRRILGRSDGETIVPYRPAPGARAALNWLEEVDWPEAIAPDGSVWQAPAPAPAPVAAAQPAPPPAPGVQPLTPLAMPGAPAAASLPPGGTAAAAAASPAAMPAILAKPSGGSRRALCVGINNYPTAPLRGCVADAQAWARALTARGFGMPELLLEEAATRQGILDALRRLLDSSRPGDVVAFQFSGHGTQLPDVNDDEIGGDSPGRDEALCPYDFASGAFLIDDDIGAILSGVPPGINMTLFIDCCHSGTISRFGIGHAPGSTAPGRDERPRFITVSDEMIAAHRRLRSAMGAQRSATSGGPSLMPEILFSACLSQEVAWESGGHGEFTVRALQVLNEPASMTNEQFAQRVTEAFGRNPRQHARLYCADANRHAPLLQPLQAHFAADATVPAIGSRQPAALGADSVSQEAKRLATLELMQNLVQQLRI